MDGLEAFVLPELLQNLQTVWGALYISHQRCGDMYRQDAGREVVFFLYPLVIGCFPDSFRCVLFLDLEANEGPHRKKLHIISLPPLLRRPSPRLADFVFKGSDYSAAL